MHSMRSGASGSSRASCSSESAIERAVRSLARFTRCRAKASFALRSTVSSRLRLSPRCGHPEAHPAAAQLAEQLLVDVGVLGQLGDQHLLGHGLPRLADPGLLVDAAVDLQEELLHQLAGGDRLDLVDDPAALAAHPAAADVEDLDRGLELVLREGDDVGVGAVAEDDGLLLHRPLAARRGRRAAGRPSRTPSPRRPRSSPARGA